MKTLATPREGESIYIDDQNTNEDSWKGGLGTVRKVEFRDCGTEGQVPFISIKEVGWSFNWKVYGPRQKELRKKFGRRRVVCIEN